VSNIQQTIPTEAKEFCLREEHASILSLRCVLVASVLAIEVIVIGRLIEDQPVLPELPTSVLFSVLFLAGFLAAYHLLRHLFSQISLQITDELLTLRMFGFRYPYPTNSIQVIELRVDSTHLVHSLVARRSRGSLYLTGFENLDCVAKRLMASNPQIHEIERPQPSQVRSLATKLDIWLLFAMNLIFGCLYFLNLHFGVTAMLGFLVLFQVLVLAALLVMLIRSGNAQFRSIAWLVAILLFFYLVLLIPILVFHSYIEEILDTGSGQIGIDRDE